MISEDDTHLGFKGTTGGQTIDVKHIRRCLIVETVYPRLWLIVLAHLQGLPPVP